MIEIKNLTKSFEGFKALDGISITVPSGSIYGLVGPNGSGKSTLIRNLMGIYRPDSGEILIDGCPVYENIEVKARMAYIPDDIFFFHQSSVKDMMRYYRGIYPRFDMERYEKLKGVFSLDENMPIRRMSKGMQKQAAFWLSMCMRADILVLDEPVDGLDPVMRRQVWSIIMADVAENGTSVLVSSHNLRELEDVCDHVGIIDHGKMLLERSLSQLQENISKVQIALPDGKHLPGELDILHQSATGRLRTIIVRGEPSAVLSRLQESEPLFMDALPLSRKKYLFMNWEVPTMLSKKSFFNRSVFLSSITSSWPLLLAYLVAWTIVLPIITAVNYYNADTPHTLFRDILDISQFGGLIIGGIYSILSVMMVWNFLYKSKTASGVACLPIKREGVFVSVSLAGILPAIIINIFVFALAMLIHAGRGYTAAIRYDALGFLVATLMLLFFFGLASLCAQLTGHEAALFCLYLVLNFVAYAVEGVIKFLANVIVYGLEYGGIVISRYLSPVIAFFEGGQKVHREYSEAFGKEIVTHVSYEGLGFIAICAAVGILLIFAALALYRRREMESAGDVVAVRVLKPIFKYCLCFGGALVSGLGFYAIIIQNIGLRAFHETLFILFFMLIGGFVGFFAGEMLNRKSFRAFRGQWKKLVLSLAIICVAVLGLEFNLTGMETRVPDAEDIDYVQLFASDNVIYSEAENIAAIVDIHKAIISEKATNENIHGRSAYFAVDYTLKNGKTFSRTYSLRYYPESTLVGVDTVEAIEKVQNSAEAIAFRKGLPFVASAEDVVGGRFQGYVTMDEYMALNPDLTEEDYILSEYFGYDKYYVAYEMSQVEKDNLLKEYYTYGLDSNALSSRATWDFSDEELWELYSQCIVPDLEDGRIGKLWINEDDEYFSSVCSGKVFIDFVYYASEAIDSTAPYVEATSSTPRPIDLDEGMRSYSFSVVPTVGSRTWQWLENKGVIMHTIGEEYADTEGYTHY